MTRIVQRVTQRRCAFGLATALTCVLATIACAEVQVEGSPAAVRVTTSQDAISDVLSALAAAFNVRYRSTISLDATADAIYSGSLGQVISRLLDGYNYVIKRDQETIEIVVVGRRGEVAIPPPAPRDSAGCAAAADARNCSRRL
jgi:hypothetical protein